MKLIIDEDVAKVADFMSRNCPAMKLQKIARGLLQLAQLIYPEEYSWQEPPFNPFTVDYEPFKSSLCSGSLERPLNASLPERMDSGAANQRDAEHNDHGSGIVRAETRIPSQTHKDTDISQ